MSTFSLVTLPLTSLAHSKLPEEGYVLSRLDELYPALYLELTFRIEGLRLRGFQTGSQELTWRNNSEADCRGLG